MTALETEIMLVRSAAIRLKGDALLKVHGRLVGVMVAVERMRSRDTYGEDRSQVVFTETDKLIAELRESTGPL